MNTLRLPRFMPAVARRARLADAPAAGDAIDPVEGALERIGLEERVSRNSRLNVPLEGPVLVRTSGAADPIDTLALYRFLRELRDDCLRLDPAEIAGPSALRRALALAHRTLAAGGLVVFVQRPGAFPARRRRASRRLLRWARRHQAALLPVTLRRRRVWSRAGRARWVLDIHVDSPIGPDELGRGGPDWAAARLRRHLRARALGRPGVFRCPPPIAPPEPRAALLRELAACPVIGRTPDGHRIHLFDAGGDAALLRELGRLREHAFRRVGEGSGRSRDLDRYDRHYRHLLLWNEAAQELVGAYRLAEVPEVLRRHGPDGLYCHSLFELSAEFLHEIAPAALELGRSFVQPRYWGRRSLDYLWLGLGAYLRERSGVRYLYGPVSLSAAYPPPARDAIVQYYRRHYGAARPLAHARRPHPPAEVLEFGDDREADFERLRAFLARFDLRVPTLFKQYAELCEPGGVVFDAFSVDPDFNHCIDGFVRVDLTRLKPERRRRYLDAAR